MISVEEALGIVIANLAEPKIEQVPFRSALGRVLSEKIVATRDIPPFNRSGVDGFALRAADIAKVPAEFTIAGESRAGGEMPGALPPGSAVAIMTGAPLPEGADAVQMIEQCQVSADGRKVTVLNQVRAGDNFAPKGSEAVSGEEVLEPGHRIGPAEMAVLATFGYSLVPVYRKPDVAVLVTGDELVEFDQEPGESQIRNSNAHCIAAQLKYMDIEPEYLGIARDSRDDLRSRILAGLQRDVLIVSGGVSMGTYDLVKDVFEELGVEILFSKVALKPGKPTVFARKGDRLVFGLPGNPISSLITFECFVRPALGRLCGLKKPDLLRVKGELLDDMRQSPGRTSFMPAWAWWQEDGWKVEPLRWKSSADIVGFTGANAAFVFPGHLSLLKRGEIVDLILLPDFFSRRR